MKKTLFTCLAIGLFIQLSVFSAKLKEPKYITQNPRYSKISLPNNKEMIIVLDESMGTGKGYDKLYADINFNNDLTDDKVKVKIKDFKYTTNSKMIELLKKLIDREGKIFTFNFGDNGAGYELHVLYFRNIIMKLIKTDYLSSAVLKIAVVKNNEKWEYFTGFELKIGVDPAKSVSKIVLNKPHSMDISYGGSGKSSVISVNFKDKDKQQIPSPSIKRNKDKVIPMITIIDEKGKIIESGKMSFG